MTIEKNDIMGIVNKLRERCYPESSFGIVFFAHYAFSVSVSAKNKYVSFVQLREYIDDSFLLPNYIIDKYISRLPKGKITIVRAYDEFIIKSHTNEKTIRISTKEPPCRYDDVADIIDEYHLDGYFSEN